MLQRQQHIALSHVLSTLRREMQCLQSLLIRGSCVVCTNVFRLLFLFAASRPPSSFLVREPAVADARRHLCGGAPAAPTREGDTERPLADSVASAPRQYHFSRPLSRAPETRHRDSFINPKSRQRRASLMSRDSVSHDARTCVRVSARACVCSNG